MLGRGVQHRKPRRVETVHLTLQPFSARPRVGSSAGLPSLCWLSILEAPTLCYLCVSRSVRPQLQGKGAGGPPCPSAGFGERGSPGLAPGLPSLRSDHVRASLSSHRLGHEADGGALVAPKARAWEDECPQAGRNKNL